ncbi:MAG: head-tail connector protein [Vibrio gallaecicus]
MKTIVLVAPTVEPITLEEAKEQLRIEPAFTDDDSYISALISSARDRCENYCNQYFTVQDIQILYAGSIPTVVSMPYPGLTVTSVTYTDGDNAQQTVNPVSYIVDSTNQTITFTETYQALNYQVLATTSAPVQIVGVQHAIKIILTDLYELRTETAVGVSLAENPAVKAMLYPYRECLGI